MTTAAVVVAAGQGRRMAERWQHSPLAGVLPGPVAKPYLPVNGRPLVWYALDAMERAVCVDAVVLVVAERDVDYAVAEVVRRFSLVKVKAVIPGAGSRQGSVLQGLLWAQSAGDFDHVIVHDGVRPMIDPDLVASVLDAARRYGAATLGIPARETVKVVDPAGMITLTPDRRHLWTIQTPQAFRLPLLLDAHRAAIDRSVEASDDCALVERLGEPVKVVAGSVANIKVTMPEDLVAVEAIMSRWRPDLLAPRAHHVN